MYKAKSMENILNLHYYNSTSMTRIPGKHVSYYCRM